MKNLSSLTKSLAAVERLQADISEHQDLQPVWEARENEVLATADVRADAALAEVSKLRLRLEILPRKITLLEIQLAKAAANLRTEVAAGFEVLNPLQRARGDALKALIHKQLTPVLTAGVDMDRAVAEAYHGNELAHQIERAGMSSEFSTRAGVEGADLDQALTVARRMLANYDALVGIAIPAKL